MLMMIVGSDLAMTERLAAHDRPLFGRVKEERVRPLIPTEVGEALSGRGGAVGAFDAYLVTGGCPRPVEGSAKHDGGDGLPGTRDAATGRPLAPVPLIGPSLARPTRIFRVVEWHPDPVGIVGWVPRLQRKAAR
ncbi:MAG: hypothetical protein ACYDB7_08335 [Mycobacteriales bacterium]